MKAQWLMNRIEDIDAKIEGRAFDIIQLKFLASGRTAQWGTERVQASGSKDKMASLIAKYIDLENEPDSELKELLFLKQYIINIIKQLPTKHYRMLHRKYVQGLTIRDIHLMEGRSRNWGDDNHKKALKELQKILDGMEEGEKEHVKHRLLRI